MGVLNLALVGIVIFKKENNLNMFSRICILYLDSRGSWATLGEQLQVKKNVWSIFSRHIRQFRATLVFPVKKIPESFRVLKLSKFESFRALKF